MAAKQQVASNNLSAQNMRTLNSAMNTIVQTTEPWANRYKIKLFERLGIGTDFLTCNMCGHVYDISNFYSCTDTNMQTGKTFICKDCAENIAMPPTKKGRKKPTRESVDNALYYLNKPMLDSVWNSSVRECAACEDNYSIWSKYVKNIAMPNYYNMTYKESDGYKSGTTLTKDNVEELSEEQEIVQQFEKNKADALKLLGYLPFEQERIQDQPFLYSQLIGFLDSSEEGNDDMMRTASIISIVRSFLQLTKLDDMISHLTEDAAAVKQNTATYKSYQAMKKDISSSITKLAEQSCISLKHSKNAKKGENTWTGKIKKIKDMNLRQGQVNGFTIAECKAMRQVMDISNASILQQLALDESEYADIIAEQRTRLVDVEREKEQYKEICRILLRENLDLREVLEANNLIQHSQLTDLNELFAPFAPVDNDKDMTYENAEVINKATVEGEPDETRA